MGVRDRLDRIAAWFGFGVDEDDYYEDEEEEQRRYANDPYSNGARGGEPGPTVRRLGRAERSSAFRHVPRGSLRQRGFGLGASATLARTRPRTSGPSPISVQPR
jgi:hypothetical protein